MKMATAAFDHAVVNAMFETDAAASCFGALGFALTPRGYHSLGSVNHLMMFHDHYLELVGLPVGATTLRREVLESRLGISAHLTEMPEPHKPDKLTDPVHNAAGRAEALHAFADAFGSAAARLKAAA